MGTGTLKELNVKVGDVVEDTNDGMLFYIRRLGDALAEGRQKYSDGHWEWGKWSTEGLGSWRIVSRASDDTPKTWSEMTDAEKGALLLAHHDGKVIECWGWPDYGWAEITPSFDDDSAYRVRPEPVRVTELVTIVNADNITIGHGTIETVNGKPDCATIKMEEL